jgi:hypothetical protein
MDGFARGVEFLRRMPVDRLQHADSSRAREIVKRRRQPLVMSLVSFQSAGCAMIPPIRPAGKPPELVDRREKSALRAAGHDGQVQGCRRSRHYDNDKRKGEVCADGQRLR